MKLIASTLFYNLNIVAIGTLGSVVFITNIGCCILLRELVSLFR